MIKTLLIAGCALVSAIGLSGCGSLSSGPQSLAPVITALGEAGCGGNLHFAIGAGSAAGLSPGAFHVENTFDGSCDPAHAHSIVLNPIQAAAATPLAPAIPPALTPK